MRKNGWIFFFYTKIPYGTNVSSITYTLVPSCRINMTWTILNYLEITVSASPHLVPLKPRDRWSEDWDSWPGTPEMADKTFSSESEALDTLGDRKMFLQLPEERPLIRRSTSPSITITQDSDTRYVRFQARWILQALKVEKQIIISNAFYLLQNGIINTNFCMYSLTAIITLSCLYDVGFNQRH